MEPAKPVSLTIGNNHQLNVFLVTQFKDVSNARRVSQVTSPSVLNVTQISLSLSSTSSSTTKTSNNTSVNTTEETLRTASLQMNQTLLPVSNVLKATQSRTMNAFLQFQTAKNPRTEHVLNVFLGLNP